MAIAEGVSNLEKTMPLPLDIQEFLRNYPRNEPDDLECDDNLRFYSNDLRCKPDKLFIDELHETWWGDYSALEYKHGFIQWLFPIQEYGMNYSAIPLQPHEIELMRSSPEIIQRVFKSYSLMLDFYGITLLDQETGLLTRSGNFKSRYRNLVRSPHNYLRISRILKHLSEMGLERLNAGFLLHLLNEQSENGELNSHPLRNSMDKWWANCIRDDEEREWIGQVIRRVRQGELTLTREMYENALRARKVIGILNLETGAVAEPVGGEGPSIAVPPTGDSLSEDALGN